MYVKLILSLITLLFDNKVNIILVPLFNQCSCSFAFQSQGLRTMVQALLEKHTWNSPGTVLHHSAQVICFTYSSPGCEEILIVSKRNVIKLQSLRLR